MANVRHLDNAPIREALIDIRVRFPDNMELASLRRFCEAIRDNYPDTQNLMETKIEFEGEHATATSKQRGFKCISRDGLQIVQARLDGFTFSRLRPYETWDSLISEAKRLWEIFVEILHPDAIVRIACRYINGIKMAHPVDLSNYITAPPPKVAGIPDRLLGFLTRVEVAYADEPTRAIVTQALRPKNEQDITLMLDIDVFREIEYPTDGVAAWEGVVSFHDIKNEIFFNSLTEKTVERYL